MRPVLREIYAAETGELRQRALETLASFPGSTDLFILALDDEELVEVALHALAGAGDTQAVGHVIGVLKGQRGSRHLSAILDYFRAVPEALDEFLPPADSGALGPEGTSAGTAITVGVGSSLFDDRFELAHVAWPRVLEELF